MYWRLMYEELIEPAESAERERKLSRERWQKKMEEIRQSRNSEASFEINITIDT
jgi:hypothetical protein